VRVADGSTVVRDDVWDLVLAEALADNLAKFELSLLLIDADSLEAALHVEKHTEVLAGLINSDHIHKTEGEAMVSPNFVVNLYVVLVLVSADLHCFEIVQSILQPLAEQDVQWQAFPQFVGAC